MLHSTHFRSAVSQTILCLLLFSGFSTLLAEEDLAAETVVTVSVGKVIRTTLHSYVTAYGTVDTAPPNGPGQPAGGAELAAAASGLVVDVPVVEGMQVDKGALLVQLDARSADAGVLMAQAAVNAADKALARQRKIEAVGGSSERALQEAEARLATASAELTAAQLQQSLLSIRAPIAGTVVFLDAEPGEWLDAGQIVAEIINTDRLVLTTQVSSSEVGLVRPGQTAALFLQLGESEKPLATGTVQFVSPRITANTNGVLVRITLPSGVPVRPGQFLAARIVSGESPNCLVVPRAAVFTNLDGRSTLSLVEGNVARQHEVQIGIREGDLLEVSGDALHEGATVVTRGSYGLPEETKVHILPAGEDVN
jgi:membrane fusion protein, multidrug efflux system